uniref:Prostaglandin E synthase 3 like n=1 Tax=Hucho hucho TaxID=62062 RepID=A0A4W5QAH8_9TELE
MAMLPKNLPRPEECQGAQTLWYDKKKYVAINFMVQNPKDVEVDIQDTYIVLSCKDVDDNNMYNHIYFYDKVMKFDSQVKIYDRSIHILIRKVKENVAWPRLQKDANLKPNWMAVDFENWRDWANEEDEGMAEYEQYVEMIRDIGSKKGGPPAMDDLDDLSD